MPHYQRGRLIILPVKDIGQVKTVRSTDLLDGTVGEPIETVVPKVGAPRVDHLERAVLAILHYGVIVPHQGLGVVRVF